MAAEIAPHRVSIHILGVTAALALSVPARAATLPGDDMPGSLSVPTGSDLAEPDARDLRHQLQIVNGITAPAGGGWTIVPRVTVQEMLTDNALQVGSPRSWDLATFVSPGITIAGDTSRAQLRLDYAPVLGLYSRNSSQNSLTQQLNATGQLIVVPEIAFIDVRALAGVQSRNGGIGGLGTLGASASAPINGGNFANPTGNTLGLSKQNLVQTSSFSIAPYLQHRFGDYGTGRLGLSVNTARSSTFTGFTALPIVNSGNNPLNQTTFAQTGRFTTGEFLGRFQNVVDVYLSQLTSSGNGGLTTSNVNTSSTRQTISNQLSYALTHAVTIFGSIGYENIQYTNAFSQKIKGLTWNLGTTLLPNPDSSITLSYGRRDGANSLNADMRYAVTPRTVAGLTYASRLGTQLQNLSRQLGGAVVGSNGSLVDSQTGVPIFTGNNALPVAPGLYRFNTLTTNLTTTLDRDRIIISFTYATQTASGTGTPSANSSSTKTASIQWLHELQPDLSLSTYAAYTLGGFNTSGNKPSYAASAALQYTFTDTLSGVLRYSYFDRSSVTPNLTMHQNLLILGITKQF